MRTRGLARCLTSPGLPESIAGGMAMIRRLFAALYDTVSKGSEAAGMSEERRQLLSDAQGATLEIGSGTGLNAGALSEDCDAAGLAEPDRAHARSPCPPRRALSSAAEMVDATRRAAAVPGCDFRHGGRDVRPLQCPRPTGRVGEIARVLKPNGRLLFLEHVRSDDQKVAKWQDRIDPSTTWSAATRTETTLAAIEGSALAVETIRHGEVPKAPKVERPLIVGVARR